MSYTNEFILSSMENSYLDFQDLGLSNDDLDTFVKAFETRFERLLIGHINLSMNKLHKYNIDKLLRVFYNTENIIVSNMNDIDNLLNKNISITVV